VAFVAFVVVLKGFVVYDLCRDEWATFVVVVELADSCDLLLAVCAVEGTVKRHLQLGKQLHQEGRAASTGAPVLTVASIRDALHAEDMSACALAPDWLDANFIAYPTQGLLE
jgi:hypothetical protein